MTTQRHNQREENTSSKNASSAREKGKQGFASMPKEQVRKIAAEGGRHSHDNDRSSKSNDSASNSK